MADSKKEDSLDKKENPMKTAYVSLLCSLIRVVIAV